MISIPSMTRERGAGDEPRFAPGQLVRHRRYGYRGVIVDFDLSCQADASWYQNNQTHPPRDQPWYHVLVDGAGHSTYVAQTNLEPDPSEAPVVHPWLEYFFDEFDDTLGVYHRNQTPWPGTWE